MWRTQEETGVTRHPVTLAVCVLACPGVLEVVHNTSLIRDMYRWVLGIPSKNLCMNFQEVSSISSLKFLSSFDFDVLSLSRPPNSSRRYTTSFPEGMDKFNGLWAMWSGFLELLPGHSFSTPFQVLVDLMTKNEKGLYEARIRATVGGHTITFHCLVGLENEAFYRSMPQVIALALDALKAY